MITKLNDFINEKKRISTRSRYRTNEEFEIPGFKQIKKGVFQKNGSSISHDMEDDDMEDMHERNNYRSRYRTNEEFEIPGFKQIKKGVFQKNGSSISHDMEDDDDDMNEGIIDNIKSTINTGGRKVMNALGGRRDYNLDKFTPTQGAIKLAQTKNQNNVNLNTLLLKKIKVDPNYLEKALECLYDYKNGDTNFTTNMHITWKTPILTIDPNNDPNGNFKGLNAGNPVSGS